MAEWFRSFFDGLYARVLSRQFESARTLDQARTVKRLLRLRKGQSVLYIPCGMGRLTTPLAEAGLRMTSVDLTAAYLRRARRRARRDGLDIRWVQSDMRDIAFDGEFDAAFNWFTSFGYFSDDETLAFCRRVLHALKPGGRFLIETMNKSWLLAHWRSRAEETIGGVRILHGNRWDEKASRVHSTWTLLRGEERERHHIAIRLFDGREMRALLRAAGFVDVRLFANPPTCPFTRHSRRLIAVARRPSSGRGRGWCSL